MIEADRHVLLAELESARRTLAQSRLQEAEAAYKVALAAAEAV